MKSERPLVSVLLPTYNRAEYLESCVESVLDQTYEKWELIISDDASKDKTPEIASNLSGRDGRIRYHRNSNRKGLPKNRNISISLSNGELVFFVEDDLILEPKTLEELVYAYKRLQEEGAKVGGIAPRLIEEKGTSEGILSRIFYEDANKRRERIESPCEIDDQTGMVYRNFSIETDGIVETVDLHACSLFPKSAFEEAGGYDKRYGGNYVMQEGYRCPPYSF